jgi:hypothetical protein
MKKKSRTTTISLRSLPISKINAEIRRRAKKAAAFKKRRKALENRIKRLDKKVLVWELSETSPCQSTRTCCNLVGARFLSICATIRQHPQRRRLREFGEQVGCKSPDAELCFPQQGRHASHCEPNAQDDA